MSHRRERKLAKKSSMKLEMLAVRDGDIRACWEQVIMHTFLHHECSFCGSDDCQPRFGPEGLVIAFCNSCGAVDTLSIPCFDASNGGRLMGFWLRGYKVVGAKCVLRFHYLGYTPNDELPDFPEESYWRRPPKVIE